MAYRKIFFQTIVFLLLPCTLLKADDDSGKAIIKKAIQAAGWDHFKGHYLTWKDKGKLTIADQTMDYHADWKLDSDNGRYRMDLKTTISEQKIEMTFAFDGENAFEAAGGMKQTVSGEKLEYTKVSSHVFRVSSLKPLLSDQKFQLKAGPKVDVDGKPCSTVKVEYPGKPTVTLFFETASGLYVKSENIIKNELDGWKDALDVGYYGDWKETGKGFKEYTKLKVVRGGKTMVESVLSDFNVFEKPDWAATAFSKP